MSYEIPPTPKPFTGRYSPALRYSPSPRSSTGNDLDLRPSQTPSRTEDTEYYIAFPPSGLPIHCKLLKLNLLKSNSDIYRYTIFDKIYYNFIFNLKSRK